MVEVLALSNYHAFPIERQDVLPLWPRIKSLHSNLSAYHAQYVALAEALGVSLVTADARIDRSRAARHPGQLTRARQTGPLNEAIPDNAVDLPNVPARPWRVLAIPGLPSSATDRLGWILDGLNGAADWGSDASNVLAPESAALVPPDAFAERVRQRAAAFAPGTGTGLDTSDHTARARGRVASITAWCCLGAYCPEAAMLAETLSGMRRRSGHEAGPDVFAGMPGWLRRPGG